MNIEKDFASQEDRLQDQIRVLSNEVWGGRVEGTDVTRWLNNFDGSAFDVGKERLHALNLLANFDFFNIDTIRSILKTIYRDLFKYQIIQKIRQENNGSHDAKLLNVELLKEQNATRFLGMGNPSESGAHLLYYFRQVNELSKKLFIHQHEILNKGVGEPHNSIAIPNLKRLVFIDDLMGSGDQAKQYSEKLLKFVRAAADETETDLEIWYFTLFARPTALSKVRKLMFDQVDTVHELDDAELAFSQQSRVYRTEKSGITQAEGQHFAHTYGVKANPQMPLGYKEGQLLLGFEHNIPNNTLPIFWSNDTYIHWEPIFPRFNKV